MLKIDLNSPIPCNYLIDSKWIDFLKDIQTNIVRSHFQQESRYIFLRFPDHKDINLIKAWIAEFTEKHVSSAYTLLREAQIKKSLRIIDEDIQKSFNALDKQGAEIMATMFDELKNSFHHCNDGRLISTLFFTKEGFDFLQIDLPKKGDAHLPNLDLKELEKLVYTGDNELKLIQDAFHPASPNPHIMIQVAGESGQDLIFKDFIDRDIILSAQKKGLLLKKLVTEKGKMIIDDRSGELVYTDHFGFRDGISQPSVFIKEKKDEKNKVWKDNANLDLVFFNQEFPKAATGLPESYIFSTAVYMKIDQNKKIFNQYVALIRAAITDDMNEDQKTKLAEAYIIGRFKDGTPVAKYKCSQRDLSDINDFNYPDEDKEWHSNKCPYFSHIYKANPRTESKRDTRIIRRGMPYRDSTGLHFFSFQRNISTQFLVIFNNWINTAGRHIKSKSDDPGTKKFKSDGPDVLLSKPYTSDKHKIPPDEFKIPKKWGEGKTYDPPDMTKEEREREIAEKFKPIYSTELIKPTTIRGIAYFLVPSISFLKDLPKL